jgi:hypothetical protein
VDTDIVLAVVVCTVYAVVTMLRCATFGLILHNARVRGFAIRAETFAADTVSA